MQSRTNTNSQTVVRFVNAQDYEITITIDFSVEFECAHFASENSSEPRNISCLWNCVCSTAHKKIRAFRLWWRNQMNAEISKEKNISSNIYTYNDRDNNLQCVFFPCWDQLRVRSKFRKSFFFLSQLGSVDCYSLLLWFSFDCRLRCVTVVFFHLLLVCYSFCFIQSCYFICFCVFSNAILRADLVRSVAFALLIVCLKMCIFIIWLIQFI